MKIYTFRDTKNILMQAFSTSDNVKILPKMQTGNWKYEEEYEIKDFKCELKILIPSISIESIVKEIKEKQYVIGKVTAKFEMKNN